MPGLSGNRGAATVVTRMRKRGNALLGGQRWIVMRPRLRVLKLHTFVPKAFFVGRGGLPFVRDDEV